MLITHSHRDHVAGGSVERVGERVPRSPTARHVLNHRDWEGLPDRARPDSLAALHLGTIEWFGLLDLVNGDAEILPSVRMVHAPGETPGHSLVRVESRGATFCFLGDLRSDALFLASPEAEFITAAVLEVDGGSGAGRANLPLSSPRSP